ncbi:MAG: hypothetical protein ACYSSP_08750 [Planctomycetota bacterium]|jgi:hypothetical protein
MKKVRLLILVTLFFGNQMSYAGTIFSENFTTNPQWASDEPTNVKWDSAGFYRARVSDNPTDWAQWGYNPLFQEVSDTSFSIEFTINTADPSYGTYPGLHVISEGVADPFVNSSLGIWLANADEFPNNFVLQGTRYADSDPIYFSSPEFAVGEWYHHRIEYDAETDTLSWQISLVGMAVGTFHSATYTNIAVSSFNQVVVGYQSGGPMYGDWAEAYIDKIEIVAGSSSIFILGISGLAIIFVLGLSGLALRRKRKT